MSAQLTLYPLFHLSGAASPSADVVTPLCRVTFYSHRAKTSSLFSLHLLVMLCPVAPPPPLELKLKH
jgi:hypothetical protein